MDLEKAIEFLLAEGARLDARLAADAAEARKRFGEASARQDRTDRQLKILAELGTRVTQRAFAAIEALAEQGRQTVASLKKLTEQQKRTEATLDAYLRSLRND